MIAVRMRFVPACSVTLFSLLLAVLTLAQYRLMPYATDDAYTHFRVVRNFLESGQPYLNPGEQVMVSSSPVWIIVLVILSFIQGFSITAVAMLNALCTTLCGVLTVRILHRVGNIPGPLQFAGGVAVSAALLLSSFQLMETPLGILLLLLGISAAQVGAPISALLFGIAAGVRYELAVVAAPLLGLLFFQRGAKRMQLVFFLLLGLVVWVPATLWYFGTLLPHTVVAKSIVYSLNPIDTAALIFREYIGRYPFEAAPGLALGYGTMLVLVLVICPSLFSFRNSALAVALMAGGGTLVVLYLLRAVFVFPWYVPLYTVPLLLGSFVAIASGKQRWRMPILLALTLPVLMSGARDLYAGLFRIDRFSDFALGAKARHYLSIGRELSARYPGKTLLTPEIGALGFGFEGKIYDAAGLGDPTALLFPRTEAGMIGEIPAGYVAAKDPDLIVAPEALLGPYRDPGSLPGYERKTVPILLEDDQAAFGPEVVQGSQSMVILERSGL
jgi:hypothetical protein